MCAISLTEGMDTATFVSGILFESGCLKDTEIDTAEANKLTTRSATYNRTYNHKRNKKSLLFTRSVTYTEIYYQKRKKRNISSTKFNTQV
jgi:hypothetical protein